MLLLGVVLLFVLLVEAVPPPPIIVDDPKVSLPFVGRLNVSGHTIAEADRARVARFLEIAKAKSNETQLQSSIPITNEVVDYIAQVGVGSPPTTYSLLVDTGSSNTWVGAGTAYVETITSQDTGLLFSVTYGSGFVVGTEFIDTVTLSSSLVIPNQGIGVASRSEGFEGVDGILGLGPTDLTEDTVTSLTTVPTVTDNLFSQGTISQKVLGVFFAPTSSIEFTNGEITFGGVDGSMITGSPVFTPITNTSPASEFFGIEQFITYGTAGQVILHPTVGIVDTGTTLLLLASDAFGTYMQTTGAKLDQATGLLTVSSASYASLQSLFFNIGGSTFEFTRNAQTWPRVLNTAIGGSAGRIYLVVGNLGTPSGQGFDFVNGLVFLERFYSIFDTTENRVGISTTIHTLDETN